MKRAFLAAATLAVFCSAQPSAAQTARSPRRPSLPLAGAITNPDWLTRPSGEDMARVYPKIAQFMNLGGVALINCRVDEAGDVGDCKVKSEEPVGIGFGQAAIQLSASFRMKPKTVDGVAVGGAEINIPINFRVAETTPPPPAPNEPAPSERAMALGRRIAIGLGMDRYIDQGLETSIRQFRAAEYAASSGADASAQEPAIEAVADAFHAERQAFIDQMALAYVRQFDEKELERLAVHFESPAQKLWLSKQVALAPMTAEIGRRFYGEISAAARQRFCRKVACPTASPVADQGARP